MYKKYIAEFVGTFFLSFVVLISVLSHNPLAPFLAAITVGIFVYTVGHVSGTHLNPAVTIGAYSIKKISTKDMAIYVSVQILGGLLAVVVANVFAEATTATISFKGLGTLATFASEAIGTFILTFGIASVIFGKTPAIASGIVIGGSLLIGAMIASMLGSAGAINPVVALVLSTPLKGLSLAYIVGPIVGSICGMQAYKYIAS